MRTEVATLIWPNGVESVVRPADKRKFTLAELQAFVGGDIERVALRPGNGHATMYVNEEGKIKGLSRNRKATRLALAGTPEYGDTIVGVAVIVRKEG